MTPGVEILGEVVGLDDATILGPCILGHPGADDDAGPLVLGTGVTIRAYAVLYNGTEIGAGSHIGHSALVREGNVLGQRVSIGSGCHIEPGNHIGDRTRIQSGGFLSTTTLGADCFLGPHVVFTDDPHPPCPSYLDCVGGAKVGDGTSIGAGTTLLPGVTVGDRVLIGAGSVVTRDVADAMVVAGNPAKVFGRRDDLGCQAGIYPKAYAWLDLPSG